MKKGIFFSIDALVGVGIIAILFSGIVLINFTEPTLGAEQSLLYTAAADEALVGFLEGDTVDDNPDTDLSQVNCKEIFDYTLGGVIESKVKKCSS